ncbi:hypothetical protein ACFC1R_29030 [Kitasatospora sp. NPDC056138]|uniref:hypothetical protein n=1 Tax=Kitasatospora sp. NPDC056138 TaxID=3345724 RepID=UPI0035DCCE6C
MRKVHHDLAVTGPSNVAAFLIGPIEPVRACALGRRPAGAAVAGRRQPTVNELGPASTE